MPSGLLWFTSRLCYRSHLCTYLASAQIGDFFPEGDEKGMQTQHQRCYKSKICTCCVYARTYKSSPCAYAQHLLPHKSSPFGDRFVSPSGCAYAQHVPFGEEGERRGRVALTFFPEGDVHVRATEGDATRIRSGNGCTHLRCHVRPLRGRPICNTFGVVFASPSRPLRGKNLRFVRKPSTCTGECYRLGGVNLWFANHKRSKARTKFVM